MSEVWCRGLRVTKLREADVLKAVTDYLAARKIWFRRMNTGGVKAEYNGRSRFVRYGSPGMADVLAVVYYGGVNAVDLTELTRVYWLECKSETGKQSDAQREFQREVESRGMRYLIVRGVEDLKEAGL